MYQQPPFLSTFASKFVKAVFFISVAVFFIASLFLVRNFNNDIFNSPDETANYYFAKQFQEKENFLLPSPSGENLPTWVYPRSMLRQGAYLIPVSFLGFPFLLGTVAKIVSMAGLPYFLIVLNALAVLFWYNILKHVFGRQVALLSGFLLLLLPGFVYYSLRPFSPNIVFVDFLIIGSYFLLKSLSLSQFNFSGLSGNIQRQIPLGAKTAPRRGFFSFSFGLFIGLALLVRPMEAPWVLPAFLFIVLVLLLTHSLKTIYLLPALIGFCFPLAPALYLQKLVYGSILASGYRSTLLSGQSTTGSWLKLLLPFGFHPRASWHIAVVYLLDMFWWLALLVLLGVASVGAKFSGTAAVIRRKIFFWISLAAFVSVWLLVFYGPWQISDRLDGQAGIGVSYVRYFLPVYILLTPLAALGLLRTLRCFSIRVKKFLCLIIVIVLCVLSLRIIWWQGDESVISLFKTMSANQEIRANLLQIAPPYALILSERSDKIFFPYREVMSFFRQPEEARAVRELANEHELWYETILNHDDLEKENQNFWAMYGLQAVDGKPLGFGHTVYRLLTSDIKVNNLN